MVNFIKRETLKFQYESALDKKNIESYFLRKTGQNLAYNEIVEKQVPLII